MRGRPRRRSGTADRGVAITLNYVLVLGISTILVTGLLVTGGQFVEDQREQVIESEMTVVGSHVAGNLEHVDRLVRAGDVEATTAAVNQSFQNSLTGTTYTVRISTGPDELVITSTRPELTITVSVDSDIPLQDGAAASGGKITAYYDPDAASGDGRLVIDNV